MKTEKHLTSVQQQLWAKAHQALEEKRDVTAISWLQLLLQSEPEFFEARVLGRQIALKKIPGRDHLFIALRNKVKVFFILRRVKTFTKKENITEALIALELLLIELPKEIAAHRLMVKVAMKYKPPLREVALLSLEILVKENPSNVLRLLELGAFCLKNDEEGFAWNPARALEAYRAVLVINPHDLQAIQGSKNASALLSMKNDGWESAESYRELIL